MEKKVNVINIYLTNADRKRLNELKYKYHLSYSTMANIIADKICSQIKQKEFKTYLYQDKTKYKTSIKPRNAYKYENRTQIYTNTIKVFCRGDLRKYMDEKDAVNLELSILNEMHDTYDENWDGNRLNRMMPKIVKKNREYYKKILEIE